MICRRTDDCRNPFLHRAHVLRDLKDDKGWVATNTTRVYGPDSSICDGPPSAYDALAGCDRKKNISTDEPLHINA